MDKNFTEVTYGNGCGYKLINNGMSNQILDKLTGRYRLELGKPYGKTYHVADSDRDVRDIMQYEHLCNYWIDRPLSYLYLTRYSGLTFCLYLTPVSEGYDVYLTMQRFNTALFDRDTLFEGHLLDDVYLVEDIVVHDGELVKTSLENRLKLINNILDYQYRPDSVLDTHRVMLKDYVDYSYVKHLLNGYRKTLSYGDHVRGITFSPLGRCVIHLRFDESSARKLRLEQMSDRSRVNNKAARCAIVDNPSRNTACFRVVPTDKPDVYELHLKEGYYDIASVPDLATSTELKKKFRSKKDLLMVCNYDSRDQVKRWIPKVVSCRNSPDSVRALGPIGPVSS